MKKIAILFAAVCLMGVMTTESQAQSFSYGSYGRGGGFSISVGNGGFHNPGYYGGGYVTPVYGSYYAPVYAPVYRPIPIAPVYPVYGGGYGGYGGGYGGGHHHHHRGGCRGW